MTSTAFKYLSQAASFLGVVLLVVSFQACTSLEAEDPLIMSIDHMEFESEGSYRITGTLASLGDKDLNGFGICWDVSENPDCEGSALELGLPLTAGEFSATVSGLSASTRYYFRAFAVLNAQTEYSQEKAFTTRPAAEDMVMDAEGNIYPVVQIGDQIWMAANLKSTMYSDKTPIPYVEDHMEWFHFTRESLGFSWYDNVLTHGYAYGGLYTWAAATRAYDGISTIEEGVQGVCPDGWHLPGDGEWKQLEMHLGMSQEAADAKKWRGLDQGGKLKQTGTEYWKNPNVGATDEFGFNALPGGYRHGSADFEEVYQTTRFWTSTQNGYGYVWYRQLDYDTAAVYRDFSGVYRGHSVRCVKDQEADQSDQP